MKPYFGPKPLLILSTLSKKSNNIEYLHRRSLNECNISVSLHIDLDYTIIDKINGCFFLR